MSRELVQKLSNRDLAGRLRAWMRYADPYPPHERKWYIEEAAARLDRLDGDQHRRGRGGARPASRTPSPDASDDTDAP